MLFAPEQSIQRSLKAALVIGIACLGPLLAWGDEEISIDPAAAHHSFPHFWEQMFGSGRAILALRDSYRKDLRAVKAATDFKYVRFHAIFHDEIGVYDEDQQGKPLYNFSYVDQIYDGLLDIGARPFVELSFMPKKLASSDITQSFAYRPFVAPPRDYLKWDALISAFASHLIERYGIAEVSQWYFEVWNEPNLDFWAGTPAQATYWTLYDHTARALKKVNARLRVGGPSTAQAAWVSAFIRHTADEHVPVDFVSTHVYANDKSEDIFGTHEKIPRTEMVCRAAKKVHDEVKASTRPGLPIIWSEYNASYLNDPAVTDSVFMGPWLADTLRRCDGLTQMMSYWTFSDVFEEQGTVRRPFWGGFGLLAAGGIPKPAFNAFKMLHQLGTERLDAAADDVLVTRRTDGTLIVALWNYLAPNETGAAKTLVLKLPPNAHSARVLTLDSEHGDIAGAYRSMGSPQYPTRAQLAELIKASALPAPQTVAVVNERVSIALAPNALATVQFTP